MRPARCSARATAPAHSSARDTGTPAAGPG